ncbi:unnamed protein product, partial [Enterobius vermicularis]|uniref:ShKT domain-containing protein n=1 Tax=Enterobius vermicularis TaxID=51028 RepID=A0A0N4VKG9_ENTVE
LFQFCNPCCVRSSRVIATNLHVETSRGILAVVAASSAEDELTTCAQNKHLCSNSAYENIMYFRCLKTCGVC